MTRGSLVVAVPALAWLCLAVPVDEIRALTFDQRVEAQRRIERVYYAHQAGTRRPFDQVVTDEVLARKVSLSLRFSALLEDHWRDPITSEELDRELERIARDSRLPDRLLEIYNALNDDPTLVRECFIRPLLAERRAYARFLNDPKIHGESQSTASKIRLAILSGVIDPIENGADRFELTLRSQEHAQALIDTGEIVSPEEFARIRKELPDRVGRAGPVEALPDAYRVRVLLSEEKGSLRVAVYRIPRPSWHAWLQHSAPRSLQFHEPPSHLTTGPLPQPLQSASSFSLPCSLDNTWDNGALGVLPDPRWNHTAIWTGSLMVVWGGELFGGGLSNGGGRYNPVTDTWQPVSRVNAPSGRTRHTALWSGSEMLIWGGLAGPATNTGGRYDPVSDTWTGITTAGAPPPRSLHTAVWTGDEMIVWGGNNPAYLSDGARYDPDADTWTPITNAGAPVPRSGHVAVWSGSAMVVWGGSDGFARGDGGRYVLASDTWVPVSSAGAPEARYLPSAVWTGTRMLVWGGWDGQFTYFANGGQYDSGADSWTPITSSNAPSGRYLHTATWADDSMAIWGGKDSNSTVGDGKSFDPVTGTWSTITGVAAPPPRLQHTAVWTGSLLVIWGGSLDDEAVYPAARLDLAANRWIPPSSPQPPAGRQKHQAVWTGNQMIIWGGESHGEHVSGGGRYDPMTDSWLSMSVVSEPQPRQSFSAVWTGEEMIVWGGYSTWQGNVTRLNTGGRYDPVSDSWQPTQVSGAPELREQHTGVWAGDRMLIWGGITTVGGPPSVKLNTGARYDPASNTWTSMADLGSPEGRYSHSALWTGQEMIVWGGFASTYTNTGGRYDPAADSWLPVTSANSPSPRWRHGAVWTGTEMLIWGGNNASYLNSGARYDPSTDDWAAMSASGTPSTRAHLTMIWTGNLAVVWGGEGAASASFRSTGGRYDPRADTWEPTSTFDVPLARSNHTAVWTGQHMLVWGGYRGTRLYSGGRYVVAPSLNHDGDSQMVCDGDCDDSDAFTFAGAPQQCGDGRNNDCAAPGWPAMLQTNEWDDDGDGSSECTGDCDDGNPGAWSSPTAVPDLDLAADGVSLIWVAPANAGAVQVSFDTLRSPAASDFLAPATCLEWDDGSDLLATDTMTPAPGEAFFYLVRAVNACPAPAGEGSLGTGSDGVVRNGRPCP